MIRKLPLMEYAKTAKYVVSNYFEEKYPFYASLKITSKCHFGCEFCDMKYFQTPDLTTENIKKSIRNLGKSSIFLLSLEGGEPLLRDDIEEILIEANKQPFYLLFTTSQRNILEYPWKKYEKYIDFLHISIDEGHDNLELFDVLPQITEFDMTVCVQTVVTKNDLPKLEEKVRICSESNSKILIMPAIHLNKTEDFFPDFNKFENKVKALKKKFPGTIITPNSYFKQVKRKTGGCSPNSIIIDADGSLFYPCRTLQKKAIKLHEDNDLMDYLKSKEAAKRRKEMAKCERQCGWYQYFATSRFTTLDDFIDATGPYLKEFFGMKKKK